MAVAVGIFRKRFIGYRQNRRSILLLVTRADITGTATASIDEDDITTGGKTIIITLSGDEWVATGGTFNGQRQNIIDGLDSEQSEGNGWNLEVRDKEVVGAVARTSDTVVTITLTAQALYNITAQEEITVTVPGSALLNSVGDIVASPTFTVDVVAGGTTPKGVFNNPFVGPFGGAI